MPAGATEQPIPATCYAGTSSSEYLGGDDFNPGTERGTTWTFDPADGGWRVEQTASDDGDGWWLTAGPQQGTTSMSVTSDVISLPMVEDLQLGIRYQGAFRRA